VGKFHALFCLIVMSLVSSGFSYAEDTVEGELSSNQAPIFDLSQLRLPEVNIYPEPKSLMPHVGDGLKTCLALDDEIVTLLPLTYRTVPDFYDDPKVAAAIWLTTTGITLFDVFPSDFPLTQIPLGYASLAYPEYKKYKESERIRKANFRIESLRRTKARMRCFET